MSRPYTLFLRYTVQLRADSNPDTSCGFAFEAFLAQHVGGKHAGSDS